MAGRLRALRRYARGRELRRRALARLARAADRRALARDPVLVRVRLRVRPHRSTVSAAGQRGASSSRRRSRRTGSTGSERASARCGATRASRRSTPSTGSFRVRASWTSWASIAAGSSSSCAHLRTCRSTTATGIPLFAGRARAPGSRPVGAGSRPPSDGRAARRDSSARSSFARRPRAGDRRAEPRRARRPRRLGRRHDEPRGGGARRSRLHDVCRKTGRGRHRPCGRRETADPELGRRARRRAGDGSGRTDGPGSRRAARPDALGFGALARMSSIWLGSRRSVEGGERLKRRKLGVLLAGMVAVSALARAPRRRSPETTTAASRQRRPAMLSPVMAGVQIDPLLTVGDVLPSGYRFESIPDGISLRTRGQGRVDLFVNHETSKVPFPYNTATPTAANGQSDFDNAQVSRLILNQHSAGVLNGSFVIPSSGGFQRFCSNYLATSKEGFDRDILFTNEESPDYVLRQEDSWPPAIGDPAEEENGVVLALDVKTGKYHTVYGMGRHNHENDVAIPGFDDLVVLSGDDTFTSGPLTGVPAPPAGTPALPDRCRPVAALLLHRTEHGRPARRPGRPLGIRLGHAGRQELLRRHPRVGDDRRGALRQGAEEHRDGTQCRRLGADVSGRRIPGAAHERVAGSETFVPSRRSASTGLSGCSSTGATSTTCSSSCASRTSPTTSAPACRTSSTSSTRVEAGARPQRRRHAGPLHERPRLEDGVRQGRPDQGDVAHRVGRGGRQPRSRP